MRLVYILSLLFALLLFTSCLTDSERANIQSQLDANISSREALKKEQAKQASISESSADESGVTQLEPKPPNISSGSKSSTVNSSSALSSLAELFGYSSVEEFRKDYNSFSESFSSDMARILSDFENQLSEPYSFPDMELSVPDDWKQPVEDNYDNWKPYEFGQNIPPYIPADGDTGKNGETIDLPTTSFENNGGVTGSKKEYEDFVAGGEQGLIDFYAQNP